MIKSMTAFGSAKEVIEGSTFAVEIRSLNGRYREVTARMPSQFLALEDRIRRLISEKISRGRVEISIKVKHGSRTVTDVEVNIPLARACYAALCELNEVIKLEDKVGFQTLLSMQGIITASEPEEDLEKIWPMLSSCINEALQSVETMRVSEGAAIYRDFQNRIQTIARWVARVKELAPAVLEQNHLRLKERIAKLTQGNIEVDQDRLAQEVAFLADKSDITEEIVRAESHLKQFISMIESEGPAGRALDFLLQELNREVNTIGSKGGDAELSQIVVALKSELEKVREQVQNIE